MTPRSRLFTKYAALIVALVSAALLASAASSLLFSYRENQAHLIVLQREKARAAATRIEQFVLSIEHQLDWAMLARIETSADPLEQRRHEYLKLLRQVPAITEVAWIDQSGREQLRVSRLAMDVSGAAVDVGSKPWFLETRQGRTWYSPVYFYKETEPYMTVARPVGRPGGGVTVAEVNLKFIWDVVSSIRVGDAGIAYVVDTTGTLIAHPDISLVLKKTDLSESAQVAALAAGAAGTASLANDLSGREVLTAHAPVPALGWTVFVEIPSSEAFAPLYASLVRTALLLLAGLIVSILASVYLARRMVTPIRALQHGAETIGAGQLDQRIDIRTGDELEALAADFNTMASELEASRADLTLKVDERTAQLRAALEEQAASAEILQAISTSPTTTQPVFDAIVNAGVRIMKGAHLRLRLLRGDDTFVVASTMAEDETHDRVPTAGETASEREALCTGEIVHAEDLSASSIDDEHPRAASIRAMVSVPLIRDARPIGVISAARSVPGPFTDKQIALLKTFADQAVIAIENVRLFDEIQDKSHQIEIANKHKSEFLAHMSHELRTPLNAIIGFSDALAERYFGELNEKQAEYVDDINTSGRHLLSLINDILDLSKVEAGRMELEISQFDVSAALQSAITLVRERAQMHGVSLTLTTESSLGQLRGDERRFKQIMLNLLTNAVKFTPDAGRVTVHAKARAQSIEIAVCDTGIGIAPEDHETVFEEFRQVGRARTDEREGTGLGLALARRCVELHGGRIWLESSPGVGSTFTFTLPLDCTAKAASDSVDRP